MKKAMSLIIVVLLLGLTSVTIAEADANLTGSVNVEVKEWLGIVYPQINLDNQSVTLDVEVDTSGESPIYHVNDTLIIDLNSIVESERTFTLPRSVFYTTFLRRSITLKEIFPIRGLFSRIFPVFNKFGSANVVESLVVKNVSEFIEMPVSYDITEEAFNSGEALTFTLYVMGFLPGDLDGLADQVPIISSQKITLEVDYLAVS